MSASQSLYVSTPFIKIEGASDEAMTAFMNDILQISIEESLHLPGMFTLVVNNPYAPVNSESKTWQHDPLIQIGKSVEIGFRASTTQAPEFDDIRQGYILKGEITAIETHFTSATQAPIVIRGYDVSHRLYRGRYNRSFQNMTDSDIVKKIAEEVGINFDFLDQKTLKADPKTTTSDNSKLGVTIEPSGDPHDYVFQENQSNMEFLRERAARIGFELFVRDGQLFFRKPQASAFLKLQWLQDIESFRVRVTTAEQVSAVEVRSWDYSKKQPIVSTTQADQVITTTDNGKGKDTNQKFGRTPLEPKMLVVNKPVFSPKEADLMSQALFNELAGEFVCADAKAPGDPRIRVGRVVELEGMGRYSGKYYITETRHLFYQGIYTTEFCVRGLRGGDLLNTLSPSTRLRPGQTHLVGIVTDNNDPQGWGRVKVKFPTLTPQDDSSAHSSYWARVVGVGAGLGRGFDCLPEINDEVLVAFEHGDIHRPYVIGGVWNGKDSPPESVKNTIDKGQVRLRTLKTRTGHTLQFVEEDKGASQAGIYIKTSGGHQIRLNDRDRSIEIVTSSNQQIRLDANNISLNSTSTVNIQAPGVTVSGTLSCLSLLTGAVFIGPAINTALNVGQSITKLQNQIPQTNSTPTVLTNQNITPQTQPTNNPQTNLSSTQSMNQT